MWFFAPPSAWHPLAVSAVAVSSTYFAIGVDPTNEIAAMFGTKPLPCHHV